MIAAQAWIVFFMFLTSIIYSIVMTVKSDAFRKLYDLNGGWMITFFFLISFVLAVLLFYGTQCAVVGANEMRFCSIYSWIVTLLVVSILSLFIGQSLYAHLKQDKQLVHDESHVLQEHK